jgi:hypothetical protein
LGTVLFAALVAVGLMAAPAAAYEWPTGLKVGAKGPHVRALQTRLAGWFPVTDQTVFEIDGVFSEQTKVALERFQAHYGLGIDGVAGTSTFAALSLLEDEDRYTIHFDFSEFWQNRNSSCSKEANKYAGTFAGGMVPESKVKRNVKRMMWRLEALRAKLGDKPIAINSGFRSVAYNRCIRGATYSQHMYGTAIDMRVVEATNRRSRNVGKRSQVHGIGCYSSLSHNHFDLRMQNESLEGARAWWWPKRDEHDRDLADDGLPCYGEIKKTSSVSASGAAIESASLDLHEWSQAELDRWKAGGEALNLHGLD